MPSSAPADPRAAGPPPAVYLRAISSWVGDPVPIEDPADPEVAGQAGQLRAEGLRYYRRTERSTVDIAADACQQTLKRTPDAAPDTLLYSTETPAERSPQDDIWDLLTRIGLPAANALTVAGSACGNLGPALAVARQAVRTADSREVLLVAADRTRAGSRYLPQGGTVFSDGAAACLVGPAAPGPAYQILGLASRTQADAEPPEAGLTAARAMTRLIRSTARQAIEPTGLPSAALRHVLTGHYGRTSRSFLAMSAGVDPKLVYQPLVADLGHCFAADILINLAHLADSGGLADGDPVLALASSPRSWTAIVLRYTAGEPVAGG